MTKFVNFEDLKKTSVRRQEYKKLLSRFFVTGGIPHLSPCGRGEKSVTVRTSRCLTYTSINALLTLTQGGLP